MDLLTTAWPTIQSQIRGASHILLACDFDGTLSPLVERPEWAVLPEQTRESLRALTGLSDYTVAIVSGRSLADVKAKVALSDLFYIGNHGMEMEGPGIHRVAPDALAGRSVMESLIDELRSKLASFGGTRIEDKGLGFSIHYRLVAPDSQQDLVHYVHEALRPAREAGQVVLVEGKKVIDVRSAVSWDKGKALAFLLETLSHDGPDSRSLLSIYLGDDVTDEDAFREVNRREGLSIVVGLEGRSSQARFGLDSTDQVRQFLERLLSMKERGLSQWKA